MSSDFEFAYGSVAGRDHRRGIPRNNQDAFHVRRSRNGIVVVVADGCGSGEHSEVGAHLSVRLLATQLTRHLDRGLPIDDRVLERARHSVLSQLHTEADDMGESLSEVVTRYFLFTLNAVVITRDTTTFFHLGDGVTIINGEVITLQPEEGNQPIYLAYALTGSDLTDGDPSKLKFQTIRQMPTAELENFLIGTDGVNDLIGREASCIPGREELVGPISQFWTGDKYFRSSVATDLRLNLMARDVPSASGGRVVKHGGVLPDDTTMVIGRQLLTQKEE